jgi:hypothetical protein
VETQVATVVVAEKDLSTVVSTVYVTVSDAATQTDVAWQTVTVGAVARRKAEHAQPTIPARHAIITDPFAIWRSITRRGLSSGWLEGPALDKRQAGVVSTVVQVVTKTIDVTSVVSTTVTAHTTSLKTTTVFETSTMYVNNRRVLP